MIDSCGTVAKGFGSVVKHLTADPEIASPTPLTPTKITKKEICTGSSSGKVLPCISALHWAR